MQFASHGKNYLNIVFRDSTLCVGTDLQYMATAFFGKLS